MKFFNKRQLKFFLSAILLLLLSIPAVIYIIQKADLPFTVKTSGNYLLVRTISGNIPSLKINDRIISIDGIAIKEREEIEIIMDTRNIGEIINLDVERNGTVSKVQITAVSFYNFIVILLQVFTSLIFILLGVFVLIKKPESKAAELFYLSMLGAAVIMLMTWGKYGSTFDLSYITRFLFHAAYVFTPVLFTHLSLAFPADKVKRYRVILQVLYAAGFIILLPCIYAFLRAAGSTESGNISFYIYTYNLCRFFLAFNVLTSITIFILNYIYSKDTVERKKLKWLIIGFITGPLGFTFLWVLPQAFSDYAFIPEQFVYLLMLSVPVCFTISIVKYHLLDIDFIINRSIVYFFLVAGIFLSYFAIVVAVTWFYKDVNITLISGFTAVFVAFLFNPIKNRVKSFVDKKFFRVQYNYREAVKSFLSEMKEIHDINSLSKIIISGISGLIPTDKSALIDTSDLSKPEILSGENFTDADFHFLAGNIFTRHNLLQNIFLPEKIESGINSYDKEALLKEIKVSALFVSPVINEKTYLLLAMGDKKSGNRYSPEDIDLLNSIINTASATAARIKLQEDLILKNLEAKQLMELNLQKSLFISTVSHELKTPLTSIKVFSELIQMNNSSEKEKINSFAEYIEGESERLTRLIDNVLSFSRIEKGIKVYSKEPVCLNEILKKVISTMEYQLRIQNFTLNNFIDDEEMTIFADADALKDVFMNLISNSIKYSLDNKIINIILKTGDDNYILTFEDFGIGIPEEEQKNLFKPYYRSNNALNLKIPGTGLGLSIIKHTADAHDIQIQVYSKLNEGTTIKLIIPKFQREIYEEHFTD